MELQQAGPIESRVSANGLDMFYLESGHGPALVLLHGGTVTSSSWLEQFPVLAQRFRVFAPDSRGHGRTDNPYGELTYPAMADDIAAFITALRIERPLIVGYSDGGQVALELALRYPNVPSALVLGGVSCIFGPTYFAELREWGFTGPGQLDISKMRSPRFDWTQALRQDHARVDDPDYWLTLLHQISHLWHSVRDYSGDELASIEAPTLIFVGDRDAMNRVEDGVVMYRRIPGSELMVVPNAHHLTAGGELANPLVLGFLRRHAQVLDT